MSMISKKVKGGSLVEVITAMLIISLSIALTGVLVTNTLDSSGRMIRQQAWYQVNELSCMTLLNNDVEPILIEKDHFNIEKNAFEINKDKSLWQVDISALSKSGDTLSNRRLLIKPDSTADE